ncbi:DsbA family protein [Bosea sp. RAC05]|uniref:DsbA family protein n=1 Tax=Bosea sp. RAC05 TaxID=1842539 RepID=UPI00083D6CD8|nr:thioredoxin domain-containing protein [Bosea sp. RAC05]AOG02979.1 DSBA-like thioredoxin domain protein [Bosea sp. RAC05]
MISTRFSRRQIVAGIATSAAAALAPISSIAQDANDIPLERLLSAGGLPDLWIGSPDAKVTIVEYASMTCTHCARFHKETMPHIKQLIAGGSSIRFVLREFPLDPLATAAFMLARAAGPERRDAFVDLLFDQQSVWAFNGRPLETLPVIARQAGMSQEAFDAVLKDEVLYSSINKMREQASTEFKVNATPTFFINGRRRAGMMTVSEFDGVVSALL